MINNKLKRYKQLLILAHADTRFTSAVKSEQPEGSTIIYRLINNGSFVLCVYRQKSGSC